MLELLNDQLMEITLRDYVCSNCWGHLLAYPQGERMWMVICHRCEDETKGYVTRYFAESRRSESIGERSETRSLLQEMGIIQFDESDKSLDQLVRELGF